MLRVDFSLIQIIGDNMRFTNCSKFAAAFILLSSVACRQEGGAEKAGERVDEMIDNAKEGENPLKKKGAGEKLGESMDKAISSDGNK